MSEIQTEATPDRTDSSPLFAVPTSGQTVTTSGRCVNCQGELMGPYCAHCGQKVATRRLSTWQILSELPARVFSWDQGLWLTFWSLWSQPGRVCRDYVHGRRKPYVNPLSYFLLGATCQLGSLWFSAPLVRSSVEANIASLRADPAQNATFERLDAIVGDTATAMADVYLVVIAQAYTYLALFACVCPLALALWVLHRRCGYQFAEVMVFSLFVIAHCLIVTAFTTPIFARISLVAQLVTAQGFYLGMTCWAHRGFFSPGWKSQAGTALAMLAAMLCFFASITVLFMISWLIHISSAQLQPR